MNEPYEAGEWSGARRVVAAEDLPMACLAAAAEVAETVAFLSPIGPGEPLPPARQALLVEVGFHGHCHGQLTAAFADGLADRLARNMLGIADDQPVDDEQRVEAAKEVANILAGNVLARLWGPEAEFRLSPPRRSAPRVLAGDPLLALACVEGEVTLSVEATCALG